MKAIYIGIVLLVGVMLAGCSGSSGTTTTSTPAASKVSINATNADAVAKGGMSPSQAMVKTGSGGAGAVGVVVEPGVPRQSVMQIALAQLKRVEGMTFPGTSAGVVGVISGYPVTINCTTSGTIVFNIQDTDNSTTFTVGDVATLTFNACVEPNPAKAGSITTTNGTMSLTINSMSGSGTSASPLNESVTMGFTSFSSVDTAPTPTETITMSGSITMAIVNNGTTMTASMSGTSFSTTSTTDGAFTMKNFLISSSESTNGSYSFSVAMTTNCGALNGDIVITTPTPFTGTGTGNPTAGVMVISGANNSSVTLTANADGQHVTITVNDGTSATQPVLTKTVTWDKL